MSYKVSSEGTTEPITLAEAKLHLKIETAVTEDDALIGDIITVARRKVEKDTNRKLVPTVFILYEDCFPDYFELWKLPVTAISSVQYIDSDGATQTVSSDTYVTDIVSEPARIALDDSNSWPTPATRINSVLVNFTGGYATAADAPEPLKQAMLLLIGQFYENREQDIVGRQVNTLPTGYDFLVELWRVTGFK